MIGYSPLVKQFSFAVNSVTWIFLVVLVLLIAITAVINFVNFMDGLDGLVAGCMAVTIAAISISLDAPWSLGPGWFSTWFSLLELEPCRCSWVMWAPSWVLYSLVWCSSPPIGLKLSATCWLPLFGDSCFCASSFHCWPARISSPSSASVSAFASGWVVSLTCFSHLPLCHNVVGCCHAHVKIDLVVGFSCCRAFDWILAG